ncbi:hypothetical protein [Caudoviricetes sp.]|nr:hypothetical protein [Caudoviricetes sp.]
MTLWTAKECAEWLKQSYSHFIQKTQYLDGFPKRCPIPGHPRWVAQDVIDWATGYREAA